MALKAVFVVCCIITAVFSDIDVHFNIPKLGARPGSIKVSGLIWPKNPDQQDSAELRTYLAEESSHSLFGRILRPAVRREVMTFPVGSVFRIEMPVTVDVGQGKKQRWVWGQWSLKRVVNERQIEFEQMNVPQFPGLGLNGESATIKCTRNKFQKFAEEGKVKIDDIGKGKGKVGKVWSVLKGAKAEKVANAEKVAKPQKKTVLKDAKAEKLAQSQKGVKKEVKKAHKVDGDEFEYYQYGQYDGEEEEEALRTALRLRLIQRERERRRNHVHN